MGISYTESGLKAYRDLDPTESKIALLRAAGMTLEAIAHIMESSEPAVRYILSKPRVANHLLKLQAIHASDLTEGSKDLNAAIEHAAEEAFETELDIMRRLREREEARSLAIAATTAQDILDRAGKRAPAKSVQVQAHVVAPQTIEHLAEVIRTVRDGNS